MLTMCTLQMFVLLLLLRLFRRNAPEILNGAHITSVLCLPIPSCQKFGGTCSRQLNGASSPFVVNGFIMISQNKFSMAVYTATRKSIIH